MITIQINISKICYDIQFHYFIAINFIILMKNWILL